MTIEAGIAPEVAVRLLLEEPGVARCLVAPDGAVLHANDEWLRATGLPRERALTAPLVEALPGAREGALELLERARAGMRVDLPRHARTVEGRQTWWDGSLAPVSMEGGTGLLVTAREVAPDEGERRFRTLFENMTEGFAVGEIDCDERGVPRDFRFVEMNAAFEAQSGLRGEEVRGRLMTEVLPGLERQWIEIYGGVALSGIPARFESYNRDLDRLFSVHCFSPSRGRFAILFTDVSEQRRKDEALRESAALLQAISDSSRDVIFAKDRDGRLRFANPATLALIGKPAAEVLGRTDVEFLEDRRAAAQIMENDRRIMESGEPSELEEEVPLPDGTRRTWLSRKVPFRDARGAVVGLLGISTDITERKRAERALQRANDQLREADRRKDEFLGMLSHELRNPLAPIRNASHVLRRAPPGGPQATRAQAVIERQTEHLTRLVDDLLDVTRIGRGKIELRRERVDLRELVARAAEDFQLVLRDRGVRFEVATPGEPVWAEADATRVTQVVGNLLHNASKFTRRGDRVALTLAAADGLAELRVKDSGAGIDGALLPHVFDPFVQGARTLARTEGGLGLGLALVKGVAELHGGRAAVRSDGEGQGTEFVVTFPLASRAAAPEPRGGAPTRPAGRRRVLVVDDNPDAARSLGELVELMGHAVELAHDGPSALARARANPPEIVLCDLGLPGMSGHEVAQALRAGGGAGMRLIAVSGYARAEDVERARAAGFDAHVAKPADPERLQGLLADWTVR